MLRDHRIAAKNCLLTTRAAKWATVQVGTGRTVLEVAKELNCDWHTVNDAVTTYGEALLEADKKRLNRTSAVGLDETSFVKLGGHHTSYVTTVTDVEHHQIIDILPTRDYVDVARFLNNQGEAWKSRVTYGALDMSNVYAAVYSAILPKAAQVVDPFHVISLANRALDAVRRRVQTDRPDTAGAATTRSTGCEEPSSQAKRNSICSAAARLASLLALGDPDAEVAIAYRVKERLRDFYKTFDVTEARAMLQDLENHCLRKYNAARDPETRAHHPQLVREDLQLPHGSSEQRTDRGDQQPHQTHQASRLRLSELPELSNTRPPLRGKTKLASARLDRGPMKFTRPK